MNTDKIYAEQLANEYAPKDTSKVVALRKLDAKAKLPANVFTYTFGIITALVAGVGMCLSMKVIGNGSTAMFVLGVIVGIIGLLGMGVNYPIYKKLLAQGKQKYAFEIMELAKEISISLYFLYLSISFFFEIAGFHAERVCSDRYIFSRIFISGITEFSFLFEASIAI